MKYLINNIITYRFNSIAEVEEFHDKLTHNPQYNLASFNYKTKAIKEKGEVVEEYYLVTVKLAFNDEKDPDDTIDVTYTYYDIDAAVADEDAAEDVEEILEEDTAEDEV